MQSPGGPLRLQDTVSILGHRQPVIGRQIFLQFLQAVGLLVHPARAQAGSWDGQGDLDPGRRDLLRPDLGNLSIDALMKKGLKPTACLSPRTAVDWNCDIFEFCIRWAGSLAHMEQPVRSVAEY